MRTPVHPSAQGVQQLGRELPGEVGGAGEHGEVVDRWAVVAAVDAEDLADDIESEGSHAVEEGGCHVLEHGSGVLRPWRWIEGVRQSCHCR
ncbi:hypothetical protein ADK58_32110 [Streptomyces sp. XY152]|nr:hypothetical protein ADK58_32110 [Streptomyces sp. XY152]